MKIETKFNIGDEVFYAFYNQIGKGKIKYMRINEPLKVLYCINELLLTEEDIISDKDTVETLKEIFSEKFLKFPKKEFSNIRTIQNNLHSKQK